MRQFLTESLVLAFTGAAVGLALAFGCVATAAFLSRSLSAALGPHSDRCASRRGAGWLLDPFGGALRTCFRRCRQRALRRRKRCARERRRPAQARVRNTFATRWWSARSRLSLLLLISAGLLLRSLLALRNVPLGFVPHNVVTTAIFLPQSGGGMVGNSGKYAGKDIVPGVLHAVARPAGASSRRRSPPALTTHLPLSPNFQAGGSFEIVGRPKDPANKPSPPCAR